MKRRLSAGNLEGQINVLKEQIHAEELNAEHIKNRTAAIDEELSAKDKEQGSIKQERRLSEIRSGKCLERSLRCGEVP